MLGELRTILHHNVVWFSYSTTLDNEAESLILKNTNFRQVECHMFQTEVIRTSINCPDVAICIRLISRGMVNSFSPLYFLLDQAIGVNGAAIPENIPKTIIFINSRTQINDAVIYLQTALLAK